MLTQIENTPNGYIVGAYLRDGCGKRATSCMNSNTLCGFVALKKKSNYKHKRP